MKIKRITAEDLPDWQNYADGHPAATGYHDSGWYRLLDECFDVELFYLAAIDGSGAWRGVLPLYLSQSRLADPHLASLESGLLADDDAVRDLLVKEALALRDRTGVHYLLLRGGMTQDLKPDREDAIVYPVVNTARPPEDILQGIKKKTRWYVRQAEAEGFVFSELTARDMDAFYRVYTKTMRRHGTPAWGRDVFEGFARLFSKSVMFRQLQHKGRCAGGMVSIVGNTGWVNQVAVTESALQERFANYSLYAQALVDAHASGARAFDLGRTIPGTDLHLFKRKWGGEDVVVSHAYFFAPGFEKKLAMDRLRAGKTLQQKIWTLLPLWLCNFLGPKLRKSLPFG